MSHLSSTPLIARAILLAGVLLAILALLSPSHFPAYAQGIEMDEIEDYPENSTHTVAAYTAMDPEGEDITWSLSEDTDDGPDHAVFTIEGGVLMFKESPDYETPMDRVGTNPSTAVANDNTYEVTVNASDGNEATIATVTVTVTVTNVEEPGEVTLSELQPKVGFPLTATLTDPDNPDDDIANLTWEWERSQDGSTGWTNIATTTIVDGTITTTTTIVDGTTTTTIETTVSGTTPTTITTITTIDDETSTTDSTGTVIAAGTTTATYRPVADDAGSYLRVTASYTDGHSPEPDSEDPDKTAQAVSAHAVQAKDYVPAPPVFPDQDPDTDGIQTTRIIAENSAPGTAVGDPVVATDIGADGSQEVLIYILAGTDVSSFDIDRATGQVTVGAGTMLDHETTPTYTVTVTATDPGGMVNDPAITVTINVTDLDEDPSITAGATSIVYDENDDAPTGGNVTYVAEDDEDDDSSGDDKTITWSLSGHDGSKFDISDSGVLTINSPPDYEAQSVYSVTVMVTDSDNNTDSRVVTITVNPVAEGDTLTLSNSRPEVGVLIRATFNSLDNIKRGSRITWEWEIGSTQIAGATSSTYRPVSGDEGSRLSVTVTYLDGHLDLGTEVSVTATSASTVLEEDANEPPKFLDSNDLVITATERTVNENTPSGQNIGDEVDATDTDPSGDDGALVYTLSGSDADSFDIDSGTGQLSTKADLDYEDRRNTDRRYAVQVTATDPSGAAANIRVTINVNNLDENPKISGDDPEPYMEGDTGDVARFTAIDPERLPILWDLSGTDAEDFSIDGGRLMFENTPDYETPADGGQGNDYEITVRATAGTGDNATTTRDVTVTVINVEEPGTVTLSELQPKEGIELTATHTDPDGSVMDPEWQWASSSSRNDPWTDIKAREASDGITAITSNTATYTPGADDVGKYLRATVMYTDPAVTEDNPSTTNVDESKDVAASVSVNTVLMKDYINIAPVFPDQDPNMEGVQDTATRSIAENSVPGTAVGDPVTAEDMGADGNQDVLLYTLGGNDVSEFDIDRETGQLKTKADLNYEDDNNTDHKYEVGVTATDPSGLADTITVTIEITDVKEAPELADPTVADGTVSAGHTAKEHAELSSTPDSQDLAYTATVSTYTASDDEDDKDEDAETVLKWSLSGADSERFNIVTTTPGDVSTLTLSFKSSTAPDFEAPADAGRNNVYNVTVVVTDSDEMTASRDVAVTVTNVEEDGTVTLSNLQPEDGTPITATLKDPDGGVTSVTWQWFWGSSASVAGTDNVIRTATSDTYTPVLQDVRNYLRATATYTDNAMNPADRPKDTTTPNGDGISENAVQAKDENNEAPLLPDVGQTREIDENSPLGTAVGDPVTATDDEGVVGDSNNPSRTDTLTYTLGGHDTGSFAIDEESGQIRVGAGTKLDYESTKKTYTVTVTATDPSLDSDTITVTIKVVDVDENPVVLKSGLGITGESSIDHDEDDTSDVATYTAAGQAAPGARWSLGGDDAGDFSISSSGVLTFRSTPDFENPTDQGTNNVYNVMVKATSGAIEASLPVTVTVVNLEEGGAVTLSSGQNQVKVDVPITAEVTDLDVVRPNTVTWQWASSANATGPWADITGATSEAYTPVEADVGNYLQATASYEDGHSPNKSESAATASEVLTATTTGNNGVVTLSPEQPVVGEAVTASLTDLDVVTPNTVTWQWASSSTASGTYTDIVGETSASYTPVQGDVGNYLQATASYTDAQGPNQTASEATANAVNAAATTPIHRFDSNGDGSIQRSEVLDAIRALLFPTAGTTVSRAEVLDVIRLYLDL